MMVMINAVIKHGCRTQSGFFFAAIIFAGAHCLGAVFDWKLPVSPEAELMGKLERSGRASTLEEQRRAIPIAMHALLDAPKELLLSAMSEAMRHGSTYDEMQRMLIEECAARYPEEAISRLNGPGNWSSRAEASWQVWSVVARTDPERALTAALAFYDPKHGCYRDRLQYGGVGRPVAFIAQAVGRTWFKRDGVAALKKLGTLPHADEIDGYLLKGMFSAAANVDDCLTLLEWFVGPGRSVNRFQKGFDVWWKRPMRIAATQDVAKVKSWLDRVFPAGTRRKQNQEADWDCADLKRFFFFSWARSKPEEAADWYASQFADDDNDGKDAFVSCLYVLCGSGGDMGAGLRWFERFRGKPHFIEAAASMLNEAGKGYRDDFRLQGVTNWMTTLPEEEREKIIMASRQGFGGYAVPFTVSMNDKILHWSFPDEAQRKGVIERLKMRLRPEEYATHGEDQWWSAGGEFPLPKRKMARTSGGAERAAAAVLATKYVDYIA